MNWKDAFTRASQAAPEFGAAGGSLPGAQALVDSQTARAVQARLNALGAQPQLAVDGSWGPKSANGTAAFQASRGLKADGIPGPDTLKALGVPIPRAPNIPSIPGLRKAAAAAMPLFQGKFEGVLSYPYTDIKGLVTVGTGNLLDGGAASDRHASAAVQPWVPGKMLTLTWVKSDGSTASQQEVADAFTALKAAWPGTQGAGGASAALTGLHLSPDSLDKLFFGQVANNHQVIKSIYPGYVQAPADAQLAMHSLSWAWGPGFATVWDRSYPGQLGTAFRAALASANYAALPDIISKASATEESNNPGIIDRNNATKALFANAADVVAKKASYDNLYWPGPVVAGLIAVTNTMTWVLGGMVAVGLVIAALSGEFKK